MTKFLHALLVLPLLLFFHPSGMLAQGSGPSPLDNLFMGFGGFDDDPNVNGFREYGSNSVIYLAEKVKRHDSLAKRAAILVYTNLPSGIAGKIRPPVSLTPDQIKAVKILRQMGPAYTRLAPAVEVLTYALGDRSEAVRSIAQGTLGDLGRTASNAVPALIDCVEATKPRLNAIWALGCVGVEATAAIPTLLEVVATGESREKVYAAEALLLVDAGNSKALVCLKNGLTDTNRQARAEAASALRHMGRKVPDVLTSLRLALQDTDARVRLSAARTLVEIEPEDEQAITLLMGTLRSANPTGGLDGILAAETLLKMRPPPADAIEFIKRHLLGKTQKMRLHAALLMSETGVDIPAVLPVLKEFLETSANYRDRVLCARAVGLIGPPAITLCPVLEELMKSKDEELRRVAADALLKVQVHK